MKILIVSKYCDGNWNYFQIFQISIFAKQFHLYWIGSLPRHKNTKQNHQLQRRLCRRLQNWLLQITRFSSVLDVADTIGQLKLCVSHSYDLCLPSNVPILLSDPGVPWAWSVGPGLSKSKILLKLCWCNSDDDFWWFPHWNGEKKVGHHLEWSHIKSKMCSVISEDNRTRIQPVPEHFRHFAHFVTR